MHRLRLLITGISGFIGRSLVEEIVNRQLPWDMYGIDIKNPVFNNPVYLKHVNFSMVDIRDEYAVKMYFAENQFDGIVHLAAVSRVVDAENDKENCVAVNSNGMKYIVENAAKNPETWFVFGSSREVYGEQTVFPVKESAEKKPINIYGECKLEGELMVKNMMRKYAILRFCNVYGNDYDIEGRVIPLFVRNALEKKPLVLEGGEQVIDFTYVGDTVDSVIKAVLLLQNSEIETLEVNICPGIGNRLTDLVQILHDSLGTGLDVVVREKRSYDVQSFIGDTTMRKQLFGDNDFVSLQQGVSILISILSAKAVSS